MNISEKEINKFLSEEGLISEDSSQIYSALTEGSHIGFTAALNGLASKRNAKNS